MAKTAEQMDILNYVIDKIEMLAFTLPTTNQFPKHTAAKMVQDHISQWVFETLVMPNVGTVPPDVIKPPDAPE